MPRRLQKRAAVNAPPRLAPEKPGDVKPVLSDISLYAKDVLRTIYLDFAHGDWERELDDFYHTDIEIPATMTVDGAVYRDVGVRFRGYSTFFQVPPGKKRSLNVSVDFRHTDQKLLGARTLNLNNGYGDASLINAALYAELAAPHIVIPRVNMVRVVINGQYWGVYANVEQIDRIFSDHHFGPGALRWKASGAPIADAALGYLGDDPTPYRTRYELRTRDSDESWRALIKLTDVLNNTPVESREQALAPMLNVEGALRVLAIESVLMNADAIALRASDYFLMRDRKGVFHVVPYDYNEAFRPLANPTPGPLANLTPGPQANLTPGPQAKPVPGPQANPDERTVLPSLQWDVMTGAHGNRVPLKARLIEVPELRARYRALVLEYADTMLDWKTLGPRVAAWRNLLADAVAADRRKSSATPLFTQLLADAPRGDIADNAIPPLRTFAERRQRYLRGALNP
jgi:hypothetical protein